jgi:hypothetical protein
MINRLGAELIYKVDDGQEINWVGSKQEFESKTKLDGLKMVNNHDGTYSAFVYHNNALGNLIKNFNINGKQPEFKEAIVLDGSCHIFFNKIPGLEFDQWSDNQQLIEDLLDFSVDVELYNANHAFYPEYGKKDLILIKESKISSLPKQLGLSGDLVGVSQNKGIGQIKYHNVTDGDSWVEQEQVICDRLHRQVNVVVDGSNVYLEDKTEEALPLLMEWEEKANPPQLMHVVTDHPGRVEYYYSYSHKRNLSKWKDAARKLDFKTIFDEPNKVYELQDYNRANKELYNKAFSTEQMIVLLEYDAIPDKNELMKADITKELETDKIFWGYGTGSFKYYTDINQLPHMMIIGASGSGKSNFINGVILSLLHSADKIQKMYLIDLKSGIEFNRYRDLNKNKIEVFSKSTTPTKMLNSLKEVEAMMYLREEYLLDNSKVKIDDHPIFIIIDEYAQINLMPAKGNEIRAKDEILDTLLRIGTRARSANIKLIVQTQDPRAVQDELKVHLMSRALLKTSKEADMSFTLQNEDLARERGIRHTLFDKGRYVFEDYNEGDTKLQELQFPYINIADNLHEKYRSTGEEEVSGINLDKYKKSVAQDYPELADTEALSGIKATNSPKPKVEENPKELDAKSKVEDNHEGDKQAEKDIEELDKISSKTESLFNELFGKDNS